MKKIILILAFLGCNLSIYSQSKETDLARVKKINGVEAYVMSEPLREYDVVVDVSTGLKAESLLTGGLINKSIAGRVEQFINRAKKENANLDAIIYSTGKRVVGIKFKDAGTETTKGMARVTKLKSKPVFVMCDPLQKYDVLKSAGGGIKWKSAFSAGLLNNSINEDVEKIVNKLEDVKNVEAFFFDGTKEGDAIKFTN